MTTQKARYSPAFAAVDTLIFITVDAQQRKIAHGLEEHRDGTQIFAERPVILEYKGKRNACNVVKRVSREKQPEHDLLQICDLHQKQSGYQRQRQCEHHIAEKAQFSFPRLLRLLVGQKVQHHGCPAGVPTPAAPEQQRAENLCHGVVDGCRLKGAEKQVVPEALDLHILAGDHAEIQQHIAADCQLHKMPGIAFPGSKERRPQ